MICPVCNQRPAIYSMQLGILPCESCTARRRGLKSPDYPVEFTSQSIKSERKEFSKDILQPYRGNEASKEFIDAYPTKAKEMYTAKEIKNAKNVWK